MMGIRVYRDVNVGKDHYLVANQIKVLTNVGDTMQKWSLRSYFEENLEFSICRRVTLVVRAGVTSLTRPVYIFETNTWYSHPTYNEQLPGVVQPNDIALIKFGRRLSFNEFLQPIKLQSSADAFRNYEELQLMASGFGALWTGGSSTENLNWVYLRGVSNTNCFSTFGSIITANTICARYWNVTSQSTCQGDSGGPLIVVENEQPVLIGVTSFVAGSQHGGCHSGIPAGFIRTGPFHSWFREVTGEDFENLDFSSSSEEEVIESGESSESADSSSKESSESEEQETTSRPTTEKDETAEEDDDAEEETAPEEEKDDDTAESDDKEHGHKKRRRRCRVAVDVKVRVGK
ncbi:Serine protease 3 [Eumeta japonica]|uniref:Serine protease 3 n=1 Tax=Eumeta variegata TaxID=151549 RepID=A0A4C1YA45_EUMVA|nr:Serine protease 3 [Eumeta japonica]